MYIKVKAITKAKKEIVKKIRTDSFVISLKEKPERNLANKRILEILSDHFKIPIARIRIINGHHSSSKLISIKEK